MKLEDIESQLPNGFHDARLHAISVDYTKREALLNLEIWVAESRDHPSDAFRFVHLRLSGLLFCVIEPPSAQSDFDRAQALRVDAGSSHSTAIQSLVELPTPLPEGAFSYWFFVNNWNSFIHIAAMDAQLETV